MVSSQYHGVYKLVLAGEPSWVPNTHMVYNLSSRISDSLVWPPWELGMHVAHFHIYSQILIHIKFLNINL